MKSFRKTTSLTLGFSFLIMVYTGLMLFVSPKGKVARVDWHLLGLTKEEYAVLHTTSMLVFILFGVLHIYYNRSAIVNYMKNRAHQVSFTGKEFLIALLINVIFVAGTLTMIQPFKAFLDFQDDIKLYLEHKYQEPPFGHAEDLTLEALAKRENLSLQEAVDKLQKAGIKFTKNQEMKEIAEINSMTPSQIYMIIQPNDGKIEKSSGGVTQVGKKTLQELSDLGVIDLQKSIDYIKARGFENVSGQNRLKEIGEALGKKPFEIFTELKAL